VRLRGTGGKGRFLGRAGRKGGVGQGGGEQGARRKGGGRGSDKGGPSLEKMKVTYEAPQGWTGKTRRADGKERGTAEHD